ncbi:MAG: polymerase subunit gamma and tau, partial [Jatrophihabitans sp.]|nr:polymerase subunit gamma and tau [Jatrophihabitans sp.]
APAPPAVSTRAAADSSPGDLDATALRRLWPEVLDVVKQTSRRTRALLDNAQITGVSGELVTLGAPAALARMIGEDSNTSVLRDALTNVVGGSWRIAVDGSGAPPPAEPAAQAPRYDPRGPAAEPEPDPRDDTEPDDAGSGRTGAVDAEAEALRLLHEQLCARPVEGTG